MKTDKTKKFVALSVILVLSIGNVFSQILQFERYSTKDGLITDEVYNLHQDTKGYLWIFSNYGTLKYNGSKFKPVLKNLPFKESFIYTIYENDKGQKWVANSNARVYEVRNDSAFLVDGMAEVSEDLKKHVSEIFKLYVDDSLNIYVITKGNSYKLLRSEKGYRSVNLCESFTVDSIWFSINDLGKQVFVLFNRKMIAELKHINRESNRGPSIKVVHGKESAVVESPLYNIGVLNNASAIRNLKKYDGNYYFLFCNSLCVIDSKNSFSFFKFNYYGLNFTRDKTGHFWIACLNGGIYELDARGNILNHYLDNITVNDILIDHQGGLWATTSGFGVYHCENIRVTGFNQHELFGTPIHLMKMMNGAVYIANTKGDIACIKDSSAKRLNNNEKIDTYEMEMHQGKLMISNLSGVKELGSGKSSIKVIDINGLVFNKMVSMNGDTLVGSTRQTIMYVVNNDIKKILAIKSKIITFEIDKRTLWIGTDNGIYHLPLGFEREGGTIQGIRRFDTTELNQADYLKPTLNTNIVRIVKGRKSGLWFCSKGDGLFYVVNQQLRSYNTSNGLPDNAINDLFFTENGNVLLATNSGLYVSKMNLQEDRFERWRKIYTGAVNCCLSGFGRIYIGTSEGLVILNEDEMDPENEKVFFNLASVMLDSKQVDPALFHVVKSHQRNLEFDFDFINFSKDKPLIKYELNGEQNEEGYIENSNFRLGQLPPGSYSLTAYPDVPSGKSAALNICFSVEPAFWQTTTFLVSCFLLVAFVVSLIWWFIARSRKKREAIRVENEQLLIEYKLIALKAQINPHFMSNCLSAIQDLIINDRTDKATFYVAQFGLMVRQILEFSSKQLITLKEEIELLTIYMELEQLRFENEFNIKVNIKENVSAEDTFLPPLILNPIVENAIWHGLLPMQSLRKGNLKIDIEIKDDNLVLSVEDNGVGRECKNKEITNNKARSHGINITEQRLDNLNYLYKRTDARLVYEDLYDVNNNPLGTKVIIYIPSNLIPHDDDEN